MAILVCCIFGFDYVGFPIFVLIFPTAPAYHKYFWYFHWNPYLKTDSANLLILFSANDFHKEICRNFYVIFLCNVSSNKVYIALGKTKNAENQKTILSTLKNRPIDIKFQLHKQSVNPGF